MCQETVRSYKVCNNAIDTGLFTDSKPTKTIVCSKRPWEKKEQEGSLALASSKTALVKLLFVA
jgi:hypothetical protein